VKFSDFVTRRQFQRTALYNEIYRRIGLDCQMSKGLPGPATLVTSISMLRRGHDFSERDRVVLDLLQPHLNQAYQNARAIDAMQRESAALRRALEAIDGHGLVVLDADDRVVFLSTRARRWLEDDFEALPATGLPPTLARWVRHVRHTLDGDDLPRTRDPLTLEREGHSLVVRMISLGEQTMLVLNRLRTGRRPEALKPLGLSSRESEVLGWLAEGKTNAEIAIIVGASVRTIDKHLEHVFRKLGVETRTAAVARALELLHRIDGLTPSPGVDR
jgi:DNA-binding CsgD family transcriptional regulator